MRFKFTDAYAISYGENTLNKEYVLVEIYGPVINWYILWEVGFVNEPDDEDSCPDGPNGEELDWQLITEEEFDKYVIVIDEIPEVKQKISLTWD